MVSTRSVASENTRTFTSAMKLVPLVGWVCHFALLSLSLSVCLSGWQMTVGRGGHRGTAGLPVKLHLLPLRGESPPPAVFQDRRTAVTPKTPATRRGLSHKTSKASAAMKTQARRALSIFTALLLSDCCAAATASTLFIHFSCCAVADPKCAIYSAADMSKRLSYCIMLHITELSVEKFYDMEIC